MYHWPMPAYCRNGQDAMLQRPRVERRDDETYENPDMFQRAAENRTVKQEREWRESKPRMSYSTFLTGRKFLLNAERGDFFFPPQQRSDRPPSRLLTYEHPRSATGS